MTGVIIFRGPCHVIAHQSELFIYLDGPLVGRPAREVFCSADATAYFDILDDVYETGVAMKVKTPFGVLWIVRLEDGSGVAAHYEREPSVPLPLRSVEPALLVPSQ
jgi:hypothetical protein